MQDEHGQCVPSLTSTVVPKHYPFGLTWRQRLGRALTVAAGPTLVAASLVMSFGSATTYAILIATAVSAMLLALAGDVGLQVLRRSKWEAVRVAARLRVREGARAMDAHPVSSIAEAAGKLVRIRGRVRVLRPVTTAPGDQVAAQLTDEVTRISGRFFVADDTGVAIVDDDALELWSSERAGEPVTIREGDTVEVLGRGEWREARELTDGYRGGKQAFVFNGDAEQPVHVRLQLADEPAPAPHVRFELMSQAEADLQEAEESQAEAERRAPTSE